MFLAPQKTIAAYKKLVLSQGLLALIGAMSLVNGCLGTEMSSRIGTLRDEKKDRAMIDNSETVFKLSIAGGAIVLSVLLSLACVQVSRNESVAFSSEYYSVIGVAVVGLIMIIVQTSLGIEMYNKVSQWNAVSKTCEKKEDPKAKAFAQTTFGVMVTFLVLTLVFIVLFIARTYQLKRARRTGGGGGIGRGGAQSTSVGMSSFFTRE
jgi:hypothetical protein